MATASTSSRVLLGAAAAAAGTALVADVGRDEHPTHFLVLGFVAVVVWVLHRRLPQNALALAALPTVSAALAVQPVLHLLSKLGHPATGVHDHASLLHALSSDAPAAGMQVAVPAVAVVALTSVAHLLYLLLGVVRSPLTMLAASPGPPIRVLSRPRIQRLGSMLHWCGWVIRAARRGPPLLAGHATF